MSNNHVFSDNMLPVKKEKSEITPDKLIPVRSPLEDLRRIARRGKIQKGVNALHIANGVPADPRKLYSINSAVPVVLSYRERGHHLGGFGTTGIGKTRQIAYLIMQDILAGNNILLIDPKWDTFIQEKIVEAALAAGRIDELLFFSPLLPQYSIKLNLLRYYQIRDEIVDHVVSGVKAKEEFFVNVAYEVTLAIVNARALIEQARGQKYVPNFADIKKWCSYDGLQQLRKRIEMLKFHEDEKIREEAEETDLILSQILLSPQDYFAKVSSTLRTVLTSMASSTVGKLVGKATENELIRRLESGQRFIAICTTGSLLSRRTAHTIGKVLLSMIQSAMGRFLARDEAFNPPLALYIDEGHNVLYPGIEELFNKGRGANLWVHFFTQSLAQMIREVGETITHSIIDNISTWLYMRVNCPVTANFIAQTMPSIIKRSKTLIPTGEGFMTNLTDKFAPVVEAEWFTQLEQRKMVVKLPGGRIYICITPEVPEAKTKITYSNIELVIQENENMVSISQQQ